MMKIDKHLAEKITTLHDERINYWKNHDLKLESADFFALVEQNHAWNFQLWEAEDSARRDDQGFEFVYQAKRAIDRYNQQRNNLMEAMDAWLFKALKPSQEETCPIHSETPGMIIDRLSILALKKYHMHVQAQRPDTDNAHRVLCANKHNTLSIQRDQLRRCLDDLLQDIQAKNRTFRLYLQLKMYNDPNLNPELYSIKT